MEPFVNRKAPVILLDETDSTNSYLKRKAAAGEVCPGTAVVAYSQTAGRGRMGRAFSSPAGKGLYLSLLMKPQLSFEEIGKLTAWAAVAVWETLYDLYSVEADIKWVNDLLLDGKKVCGILAEGLFDPTTGQMKQVILGIGLNVLGSSQDFPPELRGIVTTLEERTGITLSPTVIADSLLNRLDTLCPCDATEELRRFSAFCSHCVTLNRPVTVHPAQGDQREGFAEALTPSYALNIRFPDGHSEVILSGEVSVRLQKR